MHFPKHPREGRCGRTVDDRFACVDDMLNVAFELRVCAVQRQSGCGREDAMRMVAAEWKARQRLKVSRWKRSLEHGV